MGYSVNDVGTNRSPLEKKQKARSIPSSVLEEFFKWACDLTVQNITNIILEEPIG